MRGWTWGWIDRKGAFVVTPTWVAAGPFVGGLARAVPLGSMRTVVVDTEGRAVTGEAFDEIGAFDSGLAPVNVGGGGGSGGVWGFVDRTGGLVIPLRFTEVGPFREGLAPALTREGWGFVDAAGEWVIRARFERATPFSDGLAAVAVDGRWGYVDRAGRLVIPAIFDLAKPFSGGMGRVTKHGEEGLVDRQGRRVGRSFLRCAPLVNGVAVGSAQDGDRRMDDHGQIVGGVWDEIRGGVDGTYAVRRDRQWWLVDSQDVDRGGGPWQAVELPVDGLASVRGPQGWGVVDVGGGRVIVPPRAAATAILGEGRAAYDVQGRWTIVDRDGRSVSDRRWSSLGRFGEGALPARDDRGWALVDRDGRDLFTARFDRLEPLSSGLAAARPLRGPTVLVGPMPGVRLVPRQGLQHPELALGGPLRVCVRFHQVLTGGAMISVHQRFETWRASLPTDFLAAEPWVGASDVRVAVVDDPRAAALVSPLVEVLVADGVGIAEVIFSNHGPWPPGAWDGPVWPPGFGPEGADAPAVGAGAERRDGPIDACLRENLRHRFGAAAPAARFLPGDAGPARWTWRIFEDDVRQPLSDGGWRLRTTELLEAAAACALRYGLASELRLRRDGEDLVLSLVGPAGA